jgi:hypothetical protein
MSAKNGVDLCGGMSIDKNAILSFIPLLPPRHPIAGCKDEEGGDGGRGEVQSHVKRFQSKPQYRSNLQSRVSNLVTPTTAASAPPIAALGVRQQFTTSFAHRASSSSFHTLEASTAL